MGVRRKSDGPARIRRSCGSPKLGAGDPTRALLELLAELVVDAIEPAPDSNVERVPADE
jgi:hypothetical protein